MTRRFCHGVFADGGMARSRNSRRILKRHAMSIVTPYLQKVGGLGEARRIAEFAKSYYVTVAPKNIFCALGTIASVHFCASFPNPLALEFRASDVPFWDDLVDGIHCHT